MSSKNYLKTFCIVCKKDNENKNPEILKTRNKRLTIMSKCAVCSNKKSRFISENEGSGLLPSLRIRTPLSEIPLLNVLF